MPRRLAPVALATLLAALASAARAHDPDPRCAAVLHRLDGRIADAVCFASDDLTTRNVTPGQETTPANNSLPGLPAGAFTPVTDRGVIAADPTQYATPIARAVPGIQLEARFADDPTGQGRFLLRLPDDWNGDLVVAGASGTRSEYNGDLAWSDYVIQKGFAYASQNKGVLNLQILSLASATPPNALACRLNPTSQVWVQFYDDAPDQPFTRWAPFMAKAAELARVGVRGRYHDGPRHTYAVGTSNGGYQVRKVIEDWPELFDGGVDWEGTYVSPEAPNLLTDLPAAVLNFPDYVASGYSPTSTAARNMQLAGYPPDIVTTVGGKTTSLWGLYAGSFWEVTQCQWQKRFDPTYDTYGNGGLNTATYDYLERLATSHAGRALAAIETTGHIRRPLITLAGTMDALLPINHHARPYAREVREWLRGGDRCGDDEGRSRSRWGHDEHGDRHDRDDRDGRPAYRLYEVQNGNHIETYKTVFPQLELIEPHAQRAFDLLVAHVEKGAALPPSQCIPRGGALTFSPAQPGHCPQLFVP